MLTRLTLPAALLCIAAAQAQAETLLERGTYLMNHVAACGNCHTPMGPEGPQPGMELAGGMPIEFEGMFLAYAPNITPDPETGIGTWTDAQIVEAIREGKRPDGTIIGPPMPIELYRGLADDDVMALVAYLRSVPAVKNAVPKSRYDIPLPPAYGPPVGTVAAPDRADLVAYGAYLAGPLAHCIECHTPMGPEGQMDFERRLGAGGFEIPGPWGISVSANITPHAETGIGAWSDAEIEQAIRKGVRPDGTLLAPPMPYWAYAGMSPEDMAAVVAYLRSLPPIENAVK